MKQIWVVTITEVSKKSISPVIDVKAFKNYDDVVELAKVFHSEWKRNKSLHEMAACFDMDYLKTNKRGIWIEYYDENKTRQFEAKIAELK